MGSSNQRNPMAGTPAAMLPPGMTQEKPPTGLTPEESAKLISWVNDQYKKAKNARLRQERQWYLNMSFYDGRQYAQYIPVSNSGTQFKLTTPDAPYWRSRPVFNRMRPIIRKLIAKLTKEAPTATVIPASSDDDDLMAATAAADVWDSFYRDKNVSRVVREAIYWTVVCGDGYIKCWWDPSAEDKLSDQNGDICIQSETPFHIFIPNLRQMDIEKQAWVIHTATMDVDAANLAYADVLNGKSLKGNCKSEDDILNSAYLDLAGSQNTTMDSVLVLECWVKPGMVSKFPDGALITIAGDTVVQYIESWPYIAQNYPFIKFGDIPKGQFYHDSVLKDLIPIQREYNRTRAQILEAKNRMAKPQLMAPMGSIDPSKITSEPGQVILYRPGFTPPQPLPLQPLPAYVLQELDRLMMDFDDISGQHAISRGSVPSAHMSATAITFLQEQDDTMNASTTDSIEEGMEKLAQQVLQYVSQFWTTPRVVRTIGSDNAFNSILFMGSDLRGNTDVKVEAGSALPTSKAAKQAFIMDLMKMGFIDPNKGLELMEMGGVTSLYEELQTDDRQIQRENIRMRTLNPDLMDEYNQVNDSYNSIVGPDGQALDPTTGQPIPPPPLPVEVNTWDDHGKHIDGHNKFRKSQGFEALSPQQKQVFDMHVRNHVAALIQSTMPGGDPQSMMGSSVPQEVAGQDNGGQVSPDSPDQTNGDTLPGSPDAYGGQQLPS